MLEQRGNMWHMPADAYVVTTNGAVRRDGACVMGRGCAAEAARGWPALPVMLGREITENGNHVYAFDFPPHSVISFPVKHHWKQLADFALIERSVGELVELVDIGGYNTVILPRPGCGNGGRSWDDVRQILEPALDDRFIVMTY